MKFRNRCILQRLKPIPSLDLLQIITFANIVPVAYDLPSIESEFLKVNDIKKGAETSAAELGKWMMDTYQLVESYLQKLPPELLDGFDIICEAFEATGEEVDIYTLIMIYHDVQTARQNLLTLIRLKEENEAGNTFEYTMPMRRKLLSVQASIEIDEQGLFRLTLEPFAGAINYVEAARVKVCKACDLFFWAGRIDQKCCCKKCANKYRVRMCRENYKADPEGYKWHRYEREEQKTKK